MKRIETFAPFPLSGEKTLVLGSEPDSRATAGQRIIEYIIIC